MRQQRYIPQGGIVLSFVIANFICSGVYKNFISTTLPSTVSEQAKLWFQLMSGAVLAIAILPSLGYLIYSLRHAIFLATGGWAGLYKRDGVVPFIDRCPDVIHVNDIDVKASLYFCTAGERKEYVEWTRRRMDAYLISTSISIEIITTNIISYAAIAYFNATYHINGFIFLWVISLLLVIILMSIASIEKNKGIEGFKLFFTQVAESLPKQDADLDKSIEESDGKQIKFPRRKQRSVGVKNLL
jgi:hypothetical protein